MHKLTPRHLLLQFGHALQTSLFPAIEEQIGTPGPEAMRLIQVLSMVHLGPWIQCRVGRGRPCEDRFALAAAFIAKAVYNCATTRQLISRLKTDLQMRRLCGWNHASQLPHESTFSRAFEQFAVTELPQRLHAALIEATQKGRLIGHISRDSTAIEGRERIPYSKPAKRLQSQKKRKRPNSPKKAKAIDRGTLIERQRHMNLSQMLDTLSREPGIGVKRSSKGHEQTWRGFKLHADVADGQIPISLLLTGANVHDSSAAIPLMTMSAERVHWCYDLMDSAYDANAIIAHSRHLEHVPIVQPHPRRNGRSQSQLPKIKAQAKKAPELTWAQQDRFKERTTVERCFARLKEEFGANHVYVRGHRKVMAHLMFGVLALTVDQLVRLVT